ncbi:MAG TPA: DUF445 family protein [Candidatus Binataceae bacterium]|nr:DUF445 family protein [Candidatus Binataceae bacterium]
MSRLKESRVVRVIESRKGDVALALSFLLYLVSWPLGWFDRVAAEVVRAAGEASLVGGLCDYIALNMIFEKHWYLPNSGVLPRNRAKLVEGIANTIEHQWLTPAMIGQRLHQLKLLDRLGEHLESASLQTMVHPEQLERICHQIARYLEPENVLEFLQRLNARVKPVGVFDRFRGAVINAFVRRESARIREMVRNLPDDARLIAVVDSAIHDLGANLRDEATVTRKTADHWMDALVSELVVRSRGEIAQMVRENLNKLDDEAIRRQIESRTRTHLDWIRVNGGIFGAILGCLFALLNTLRYDFHALVRIVAF